MTPPLEFSHVGFFVTDLDKMRDFYSRVLGFPITDEGLLGTQRLTFLSRNPKEHHQVVLVEGRPRTLPKVLVNSLLVAVCGATTFTAPSSPSVIKA